MPREPSFEVRLSGATEPGERLLVGMAGLGVAGLTAVDYLVSHVETTEIGHVRTHNLSDITPFSDGRPRRPIRLYSTDDSDVTVLIIEPFLPLWATEPFVDSLLEWTSVSSIRGITILHGAPFPHSEKEHVVFHVGTDEYRNEHFPDGNDSGIEPLAGGFFDGVVGELMLRSLDGDAPPTGVLVTPTHLPGPDLDAAVRLLEALEPVCDIEVEEAELRTRAEEMRRYYAELAERMRSLQEGDGSGEKEYPTNRMFM